ncbi:MAG TPA: hypothetical protein VK745_31005 [Polyangiaceae bacterium]|nr:hypothetical protein [Polyangiaceae bacterium]
MIRVTRIAVAGLGVLLGLGLSACGQAAPREAQPADAGADAGDSGADAASDSGVEQVDAATSCSDLYTLAREQLDEAAACDLTASSGQCQGSVAATCGCPVTVNSQTSAAAQSYLNTLSVIQAKMCGGKCPPQFCEPITAIECVAQAGGTGGVCVHHTD